VQSVGGTTRITEAAKQVLQQRTENWSGRPELHRGWRRLPVTVQTYGLSGRRSRIGWAIPGAY